MVVGTLIKTKQPGHETVFGVSTIAPNLLIRCTNELSPLNRINSPPIELNILTEPDSP